MNAATPGDSCSVQKATVVIGVNQQADELIFAEVEIKASPENEERRV